MDFSKTKKKKKKKKDLDELVAEDERKDTEEKDNGMYNKKSFVVISLYLVCLYYLIFVNMLH